MNLSQKIAEGVESAAGLVPLKCEARDESHRLAIDLTAASPVGVSFDALEFSKEGVADLSSEALRAWGDRLAARLTYLMEPLVVLEVDAQAGEAELRSQTPTPRGDRKSYYEVRLRRDASLRLRRIGFDETTRHRQAVPCQMTREVLERLADDLVASLA